MVDEDIIDSYEITGKGGHRAVYVSKKGIEYKESFKEEMAQRIQAKVAAELSG